MISYFKYSTHIHDIMQSAGLTVDSSWVAFKHSWPWPWIGSYGIIVVIDIYLHTKFHWNQKNFFLDGLTAGTRPSSRLRDTKSRTKFIIKNLRPIKFRYCAVVTFCVSRRPREMYCGHAHLCVCLSVCLCVCLCVCPRPHAHTIARTRM